MFKFKEGDLVKMVEGAHLGALSGDEILKVCSVFGPYMTIKLVSSPNMTPDLFGMVFIRRADSFELIHNTNVTIKIDNNFNIISGDISDDEQKDFYTALQEWQSGSKESSTSNQREETEAGEQHVRTTYQPSDYQLGTFVRSGGYTWDIPAPEFVPSGSLSELQVGHLSNIEIEPERYQPTTMDYRQRRSNSMGGAGERGGRTYTAQRTQRERDRDDNLNRFFGRV